METVRCFLCDDKRARPTFMARTSATRQNGNWISVEDTDWNPICYVCLQSTVNTNMVKQEVTLLDYYLVEKYIERKKLK